MNTQDNLTKRLAKDTETYYNTGRGMLKPRHTLLIYWIDLYRETLHIKKLIKIIDNKESILTHM